MDKIEARDYRGKKINNDEWVYGDCHKAYSELSRYATLGVYISYITDNGIYKEYEVVPESVGQYTGRKTKAGIKIYEGDKTNHGVVEWCDHLNWDGGGSEHPGFFFTHGYIGYVNGDGDMDYHTGFNDNIEVLGTIHDNPE